MASQFQMDKNTVVQMSRRNLAQISSVCEVLGEKFRCIICHDQWKYPVKLKCRHTFCRMCIEQHIRTKNSDFLEQSADKRKASCPLGCEKTQLTKRNLADDLESSPLQKAVLSLARILEDSLGVDLQQVRAHPSSIREAPSPSPKSKKRMLDLRSSLKTRSKPSDENDVPKGRHRKIKSKIFFPIY